MLLTKAQRRKIYRTRIRYLLKHPIQLCKAAKERVRFMWWLTGNFRQQEHQTVEIRFWYGVRKLLHHLPGANGACRKAAP